MVQLLRLITKPMRQFSISYRLISLILMIQILTGTVGYAITRTECKVTGQTATTINELNAQCLQHESAKSNNLKEASAENQNCTKHKHHECCSKKGKHKKTKSCCSADDKNCCTTVSRAIHLNPFNTSIDTKFEMSLNSESSITTVIYFAINHCSVQAGSTAFYHEPPEPLSNREILHAFSRLII